jgi:hypothetical protein
MALNFFDFKFNLIFLSPTFILTTLLIQRRLYEIEGSQLIKELHCQTTLQQPLSSVGLNTLYVVAILIAVDYLRQLDVCILLTERQKVKLQQTQLKTYLLN